MARTVFKNANLLDGSSAAQPGMSVAIDGGKIVSVATAAAFQTQSDDTIVDLAGQTLMPGLIQSHWHGSYRGIDFACPPVGLEKPPGYLMLVALTHAQLALSMGYTTVIGAATGDALDAQLKWAIADGIVEGPRIVPCGRWLITTGDANDFPEFWWWGKLSKGAQEICDGPYEFRRAVRQEIKEGAEIIKIFADAGHALIYGKGHVSMAQDEVDAVVQAAHDRGKKVRAHVDTKRGILNAIKSGIDLLDHADEMDEECIDAMVESGVGVCPSMYFPKAVIQRMVDDGLGWEKRPMAVEIQRDLDRMSSLLPYAAKRGAKFLIGDDWGTAMTPHGQYNRELELYVESGVPALDVIRWATANAAEFLGMKGQLGCIAEGAVADLVVVKGDPSRNIALLGDTANIRAVMKEGAFTKAP
jgi:imidazolonepropionase-like amidohydrolase